MLITERSYGKLKGVKLKGGYIDLEAFTVHITGWLCPVPNLCKGYDVALT